MAGPRNICTAVPKRQISTPVQRSRRRLGSPERTLRGAVLQTFAVAAGNRDSEGKTIMNPDVRATRALKSLILGAATLLTALTPSARAAVLRVPDIAIGLDTPNAVVAISIDDASGVEEVDLVVGYDPLLLSVSTPVLSTDLSSGCIVASNYDTPGIVYVSVACPEPMSGSGALVSVPVQPLKAGTGTLDVRCELNGLSLPCDVGMGSVTIENEPRPAKFDMNVGEAHRAPVESARRIFGAPRSPEPARDRRALWVRRVSLELGRPREL